MPFKPHEPSFQACMTYRVGVLSTPMKHLLIAHYVISTLFASTLSRRKSPAGVRRYSPWWQSRRLLYIRKRTDEWYFSQKKILVTGAGSGLGREIALAFSRLGGTVILAGRNKQKLEETAQAISETLGKSWVIPFDVNNNQSIDNLFDEIKNRVGTLDIAVNNAGVFSLVLSMKPPVKTLITYSLLMSLVCLKV